MILKVRDGQGNEQEILAMRGPKGLKGDTGERGPKGDTGAKGEQGEPGTNGTQVIIAKSTAIPAVVDGAVLVVYEE